MRWTRTRRGNARFATASSVTDARRGTLWLVDLGEPVGREQGRNRPALVVSSDQWNRHASTVTILPLTRTQHGLPTRIEIEPDGINGLSETSYARCEDIRSISERRLVHLIGRIDLVVMAAVSRTIRLFLDS